MKSVTVFLLLAVLFCIAAVCFAAEYETNYGGGQYGRKNNKPVVIHKQGVKKGAHKKKWGKRKGRKIRKHKHPRKVKKTRKYHTSLRYEGNTIEDDGETLAIVTPTPCTACLAACNRLPLALRKNCRRFRCNFVCSRAV